MAYTIHKSDGTAVTVPDNAIDIAYYNQTGGTTGAGQGTQLVGRNTIDYGAPIAQNFLQMVENFASGTGFFPSDATALQGQLWFNKTSSTAGKLYVRVSSSGTGGMLNWQQVITLDSTGSSTIDGTLTVTGLSSLDGGLNVTGDSLLTGKLTVTGDTHLEGDLTVDGAITAEGGLHVPVTFTAFPLVPPQVAQNGDMLVVGSVVSIYAGGAWQQVFPAIYS